MSISVAYTAKVAFRDCVELFLGPPSENVKRLDEQGVWWRKSTGMVLLRKVRVRRVRGTKASENVLLGRQL